MKKIKTLAICLIILLFIPAIAAAADVEISGELDFGKYFGTDKNICSATISLNSQITDDTQATVDLSGNWAGNARRKGVIVLDDAMVTFKEKFGTITFGYYKYDITEIELLDPDHLDDSLAAESDAADPSTSELTASLSAQLTSALTLNLSAAAPPGGIDYSAGVAMSVAAVGAGITYTKNAADPDASYVVNGSYTIKALKLYLTLQNWIQGSADTRSLVLGTSYDSQNTPFYGQVEYDLDSQGQTSHTWSLCTGYKINKGIRMEYNQSHQNSNTGQDDRSLKMKVIF